MTNKCIFVGAKIAHPSWNFVMTVVAVGTFRFLYTRESKKGEFVATISNKFYPVEDY